MDLYAGIYLYFFNVEKFSFLLSSSELNFVSEITPWPHHSLDRECSNTFGETFWSPLAEVCTLSESSTV